MGYLADEEGRWCKRWIEINRTLVSGSRRAAPEEIRAIMTMEEAISKNLVQFFHEHQKGRDIIALLVDAMRSPNIQLDEDYVWVVRYSSTFMNLARTILQLKAIRVAPSVDFLPTRMQFASKCPMCSGEGITKLAQFDHTPTQQEVVERLLNTRGYIPPPDIEKILPASILKAEVLFARFLDQYRGEGLFDSITQAMDEGIYALPTKHLLDYHLWIYSQHLRGDRIVAMSFMGELTPRSRYQLEVNGKAMQLSSCWEALRFENKDWEEAPKTHLAPCSQCDGECTA